jgi:DNA-binding response OmpR family regulator
VRNAERTKHVPVIMITSRSTEKHRQQGMAAGVDVYLTKPFSDEILLDHVAGLIGR